MKTLGLAVVLVALAPRTCVAQSQSAIPGVQGPGPHNGPVLPGLYMRRFDPPDEYRRWYHAMEACVGAHGNYDKVEWLMVSAPWLDGQRQTHGSWTGNSDGTGVGRIVLNLPEYRDSTLVQHEALHDILWRSGWRRPPLPSDATDTDSIHAMHPTPPFERCAPMYYADPS